MAKRSFPRYVEQELGKFPHFLVYAILEWVLIILLFIDGFLAFVANEYARFFELRVPCLLCTRIDHVLVHRNPDFYYNDSVCEAHKKEVSSLAYCHNHKKMSDIRNMCEACLLSFATEKESDCNTYKALVGILHKDLECFVEDDSHIHLSLPAGRKDDFVQVEKSSKYCCSCCGEPLKVKSSYSKGKGASAYSLAPASSPRTPFLALRNEESRSSDLAHIQYTELKFISENNSPPEDEDGLNALNPDTPFREDVKAATVPLLTGADELNEDASKTNSPNFGRGNRFFGIPLTDSATNSPRWGGGRITRKSPLEKTASASESIEENLTNEADSDSILHHLKRQVRLDRKSLMALYMELDEERSASAIAANNAMAMITRLQAEKAAVQMEALQYQRMMEEQAEYDEEALQATNDLLAKREEDFKVIEAELEAYRGKYGCSREDDDFKQCEMEAGEDYCDYKAQSSSPLSAKSESGGSRASVNEVEINGETALNNYQALSSKEANGGGTLSESLKGFKGEESPILGRFKKLDKRNQLVLDNGVYSSLSSFDSVEHINDELEKSRKPVLTRELSHLSKRVKALEADNGFLDHAAQTLTLEKHSEGTTLLLEISRNLRKLRHLVTSPIDENDAGLSS